MRISLKSSTIRPRLFSTGMSPLSTDSEVLSSKDGRLSNDLNVETAETEMLPRVNIALMLDLRTDFSLPCKLIVEEHFLYDSIFTRI